MALNLIQRNKEKSSKRMYHNVINDEEEEETKKNCQIKLDGLRIK